VTRATVRGIELDYESFGDTGAPAVLLVMGLGMPGIAWPDPLVDGLVAAGFRVIRFDNRDCGHSSKVAGGRLPDLRLAIARALLRRPVRAPYTLDDMAADAVGLLDASASNARILSARRWVG
jgi:pimeloyl-ACP methyl ester carboxylesterase